MTRKARGAQTQALAAAWFRPRGFPYVQDAGAGRPGRDLLGMVGLAGEIKARANFDPLTWIRQAKKAAAGDLPFVLIRCNGQGPASIAEWPVMLPLADFTRLIRAAGYGDPEKAPAPPPFAPDPELIDHLEGNRLAIRRYKKAAEKMRDDAATERDTWAPS